MDLRTLSVDEVSGRLRPGDLILFQGQYLVSYLYRLVTGGDWYTHAAIAAHWDGDWILLQAEAAGVQAVELRNAVKKYNGRAEWYALTDECRQRLDLKAVFHEARRDLGVPFGVLHFLVHLTHWWLGLQSPRRSGHSDAFFCSQYVSHCFRSGDVDLTGKLDQDAMPDDISRSVWLTKMGKIRL